MTKSDSIQFDVDFKKTMKVVAENVVVQQHLPKIQPMTITAVPIIVKQMTPRGVPESTPVKVSPPVKAPLESVPPPIPTRPLTQPLHIPTKRIAKK